jgi:hypothetical protein
MIDHHRVIGLFVAPLAALEEPLDQTVGIVEAFRERYPVFDYVFPEAIKCTLFLGCQLSTLVEYHTLTFPLAFHHDVLWLGPERESLSGEIKNASTH